MAVELRHKSWSDDKNTAILLRRNNIAWVNIDEPRFLSSISPEFPLTGGIAYFRFHGRNAETWWSGDNETRYKYLYQEHEIKSLAERVRETAGHASLVFAFFNNHWKGYAPRNAVDMIKSLELPLRVEPVFGGGSLF